MTVYIESYTIGGWEFGIEDFEDGQPMSNHFFGYKYKKEKPLRFNCWANGCGIGNAKTLLEAKQRIINFALDYFKSEYKKKEKDLKNLKSDINDLENNNLEALKNI